MSQAAARTLKNAKGVAIEPRGIFYVNFPPPLPNQKPRPPNIGVHVCVVLKVLPERGHVAVIYGESNSGPGSEYVVSPKTMEGFAFEPWIQRPTHFRDDTVALVRASLIGDEIGACLGTTQTELEKIADAAMVARTVIDLRNYAPAPPPAMPATSNPGQGQK